MEKHNKSKDPPKKRITIAIIRLIIGVPPLVFLIHSWSTPEGRNTLPKPIHVADIFLLAWVVLPILSWLWNIATGKWKTRAENLERLKEWRPNMNEAEYTSAVEEEFSKQNIIDKIGVPLRFWLISIIKSLATMMFVTATYLWFFEPNYAKQDPNLSIPILFLGLIIPGVWITSKIFQYVKWHFKYFFKSANEERTKKRIHLEMSEKDLWRRTNQDSENKAITTGPN